MAPKGSPFVLQWKRAEPDSRKKKQWSLVSKKSSSVKIEASVSGMQPDTGQSNQAGPYAQPPQDKLIKQLCRGGSGGVPMDSANSDSEQQKKVQWRLKFVSHIKHWETCMYVPLTYTFIDTYKISRVAKWLFLFIAFSFMKWMWYKTGHVFSVVYHSISLNTTAISCRKVVVIQCSKDQNIPSG